MHKRNRQPITFELVETKEQWNEVAAFAHSFNHKFDDTTITPVVAVRRGKKLFAYFIVLKHPVMIPSFHPGLTTKRDFLEAVEQIRAYSWLSSLGNDRFPRGVAWAAFANTNVSRALLERIGFKSTNCELFLTNPEAVESEVAG